MNPIASLITSRLAELGLTKRALVDRCGYQNTSKALRRLDALLAGDLTKAADLIARLPAALDLPDTVVIEAVMSTVEQQRAENERRDQEAFRPHAVLLTENKRPTSITMFAFSGSARWLRIDMKPASAPETYVDQVQTTLRHRVSILGGTIPFMGRVTGFFINFAYDLSVQYDLDGHAVDAQPEYRRGPQMHVSLANGRSVANVLKW